MLEALDRRRLGPAPGGVQDGGVGGDQDVGLAADAGSPCGITGQAVGVGGRPARGPWFTGAVYGARYLDCGRRSPAGAFSAAAGNGAGNGAGRLPGTAPDGTVPPSGDGGGAGEPSRRRAVMVPGMVLANANTVPARFRRRKWCPAEWSARYGAATAARFLGRRFRPARVGT